MSEPDFSGKGLGNKTFLAWLLALAVAGLVLLFLGGFFDG